MNNTKPLLIVGLGNPGAEFLTTRHNAGFMALDAIAGDPPSLRPGVANDTVWKKAHDAHVIKGELDNIPAILAKPTTFMNDSGRAVRAIMAYYKIPLENLTVIHDDMDLKLGDVRVKTGGGSAGHNGIKSIDAAVGSDYKRIRIGVGHPRDFASPISPHDWVLARFPPDQFAAVADAIENKVMKLINN